MAKHKIRNVKVFKSDIWSFYQNIFPKMGKINFPQMILIFERLENTKANTILTTYIVNLLAVV